MSDLVLMQWCGWQYCWQCSVTHLQQQPYQSCFCKFPGSLQPVEWKKNITRAVAKGDSTKPTHVHVHTHTHTPTSPKTAECEPRKKCVCGIYISTCGTDQVYNVSETSIENWKTVASEVIRSTNFLIQTNKQLERHTALFIMLRKDASDVIITVQCVGSLEGFYMCKSKQ